ncbi:adenosine deaminase [Curtobacterium sp. MCBD17_013]|nr:adenosine deaminase [Curtobacterium sp. MCBD17_013]
MAPVAHPMRQPWCPRPTLPDVQMPVHPTADDRLRALPKTHLHAHLDGSYPVDAVRALATRRGLPFHRPERFADVWAFFDAYGTVPALVATHEDLAALCRALVHAEAAEGVRYLEPAVEPQLYAERLGGNEQVLRTVLAAFAEAAADAAAAGTPVEVGADLTLNTDADADLADELGALAARFAGSGVTALGTACFDEDGDLAPFVGAARAARAAGLPVVSHAGQTGGPDRVTAVLDVLGASRISHGFRAVEDARVTDRLATEGIVCDVCPVSNVRLGVVADLASHPAPILVERGVPVTLNADDPLWFGATVSDQYAIARTTWGFDDQALADLARTGTRATGMSADTRDRFDRELTAWLTGGRA